MKILFICTSLNIGGTETYLLRLISYIKEKQYNVELYVLCKSGRLGSLEKEYRSYGTNLIPLKIGYFNLIDCFLFMKLLGKEKFDVVCDFTGTFAGLTLLMARMFNCKQRISFYRNEQVFFKSTVLRGIYCSVIKHLVFCNATLILSNSAAALDRFFPNIWYHYSKRFEVIPNGICLSYSKINECEKSVLRNELRLTSYQKIIGHVSRYAPQKNHKMILNVAEWFLSRHENVIFLLIGRGVKEQFDSEVKRRGLNNVRFAGERRDVIDILALLDAFYFPSLAEGQPNALLEAVASGVPFVASNISSISSCFPQWWGNRWLVSPNDLETSCEILEKHLLCGNEYLDYFNKLRFWLRENNSQESRFDQIIEKLYLF